jgi:imidazole glycerol-phosphate synthase subunit HisH
VITIVDYGMGNTGSIKNMLKKIGFDSIISASESEILNASKLIIPGVGAFDAAMRELKSRNIIPLLNNLVLEKRLPTLGICLGMQLMTEGSEEGQADGLAWVKGRTRHFSERIGTSSKIPHMGWNVVNAKKPSQLLEGFEGEQRFYFVHSYHVELDRQEDLLLTADYGFEFHAAFEVGNIFGVQFHPEKSQRFGFRLLSNFASLD